MSELWKQVGDLIGIQLRTTTGDGTFEITKVLPDFLSVTPHGGFARTIQRRDIELAGRLHRTGTPLTPSELKRSGVSDKHVAYIASILRALPER